MQLEPVHPLIGQQIGPPPYRLQSCMEHRKNKHFYDGCLEKTQNFEKDCFLCLLVRLLEKKNSVKIAIDSRKLNNSYLNWDRVLEEYGTTTESNCQRNLKSAERTIMKIKNGSRLRIWLI